MAITPATLIDAPELVVLINSAYRGESSKKGWTTEANLIDGQRIDAEGLTEQMDDPKAIILKSTNEDNQITGCVYLQKRSDKLYLGMLTVSPTLQAGGLGRKLLETAEDYARSINYHTITMTVITTRTELLEWYERRGYAKTGEVIPLNITERNGILRQPVEMYKLEKLV
ncbi:MULTISPECIES: GNAT family N-acetyltransferase [unclassified Mucilaginibacter]|uniref:GNAT family N-acetyltransferase n=1 Tax=unclassified Mucilaginibacter TaxID=2617802 RepID=UPI002AC8F71F|nr:MULTISPECIES: GNAT family N-acetyltransferase [unclassified Mucilaginibacter]MEB0249035.1 GNAT family N-acetyltransferase [Mucilaginibacter sp. 5B2]MEB0263810.1 GNAT family N-acetyltransferase [Mucilaginibacter sp. 10I4]MEB0276995.1 GNAT family N-acetyltransferase [Mucilaginibacter sp. 10B2]MEB0301482.1 GNAT family N-acetyltransferase [Mucilaginibacter sp. 5C4]WPX25095.1 GNAT family N-acetyltransferase [Mucilaginibacter sp. 5C4]